MSVIKKFSDGEHTLAVQYWFWVKLIHHFELPAKYIQLQLQHFWNKCNCMQHCWAGLCLTECTPDEDKNIIFFDLHNHLKLEKILTLPHLWYLEKYFQKPKQCTSDQHLMQLFTVLDYADCPLNTCIISIIFWSFL